VAVIWKLYVLSDDIACFTVTTPVAAWMLKNAASGWDKL